MKKVLFIGNSHTYMNDMPEIFRQMMENATGESCEVFMLAYSARSLKWHMEEEYFSERFNILHGGYDYCVIQEQAHPMTSFEDTEKYAARIIELCKKVGTKPVIFETWAEKLHPENQPEMNRRYHKIAEDNDVLLAPVGEIWEKTLAELEGDADLYFTDGAHASAVGDYLIAMTLVKTITGKLPDDSFVKSFDFTIPGDNWQPVKEDISDEEVQMDDEVVNIIRRKLNMTMR
ncbi:MAG: hypothetical protein IJR96_01555 [Pseudobutyrivibrio sp.]|nr:hypothetical protein [Pseudobutyrivibrio sp.]